MTTYTIEERCRVVAGFQCPECFGCRTHAPDDGHYNCLECGCRWDSLYFRPLRPEIPRHTINK